MAEAALDSLSFREVGDRPIAAAQPEGRVLEQIFLLLGGLKMGIIGVTRRWLPGIRLISRAHLLHSHCLLKTKSGNAQPRRGP